MASFGWPHESVGPSLIYSVLCRCLILLFLPRCPWLKSPGLRVCLSRWRCEELGHKQDQCGTMEIGTVIRIPDAPAATPNWAGANRIPVSIQGVTYYTLVDSGCEQISIHQEVSQSMAAGPEHMMKVLCVHGDVHKLVPLPIHFRG